MKKEKGWKDKQSQEKYEYCKTKFADINCLFLGLKNQLEIILRMPEEHICLGSEDESSHHSQNAVTWDIPASRSQKTGFPSKITKLFKDETFEQIEKYAEGLELNEKQIHDR